MLDQADINLERPRDGIADVPLPYAYPEFLEHQPREVSPFKRAGVAEEPLRHPELLPLGPLPSGGRHPLEVPIHLDEVHLLNKERRLLFVCKEPLDGKARIAGCVDRLANRLPLCADDVGHGIVEEVWAYAEFLRAPVGKDSAPDEADKDGEFFVVEPGQDRGDLLDQIQASGDPFQVLADTGELQKLHTHSLL